MPHKKTSSPGIRGGVWRRGLLQGVGACWDLLKLLAPVSVLVIALQHTPLLPWFTRVVSPAMSFLGLSGDAAVVLVVGKTVGLYSALGAMASLSLSAKEVLILSLMLSFSHNLLVETAVTHRLGVGFWRVIAYRVGLALFAALIVHGVYVSWHAFTGSSDVVAFRGAAAHEAVSIEGHHLEDGVAKEQSIAEAISSQSSTGFLAWLRPVMVESFYVLLDTVVLLIAILLPLMVFIEFLKQNEWLEKLSRLMAPWMGRLGMTGKASFPLLAGIVFGLAYGAGVILQSARDGDLSFQDRHLLCIFLIACHAVIEDTLLFVPFGVNPFLLLGVRFVLALMLTWIVARFSNRSPSHATRSV